jgi:uncharacterized DUF497 family protein
MAALGHAGPRDWSLRREAESFSIAHAGADKGDNVGTYNDAISFPLITYRAPTQVRTMSVRTMTKRERIPLLCARPAP